MKYIPIILLFSVLSITSCSKHNSPINDYCFAASGKDTLLLFPSNEVILLRNGKSHYFEMHFLTDDKYDNIKNKNSFFVYLFEYGSEYRVYDGRIHIAGDNATQKIDFLEVSLFDSNFLLEEEYEFGIFSQTYFCFDYTNEYKEKARQLLFKEREHAENIKRLDNEL